MKTLKQNQQEQTEVTEKEFSVLSVPSCSNPGAGDADFVFLACRAEVGRRRARATALAAPESDGGGSPYIDNRPLLVATKPELREYKAVYVQSDAEIGLFSDEVVVKCAP